MPPPHRTGGRIGPRIPGADGEPGLSGQTPSGGPSRGAGQGALVFLVPRIRAVRGSSESDLRVANGP